MCWSHKRHIGLLLLCVLYTTADVAHAAAPTVATTTAVVADTSAEVIPVTLVAGQAVHVVYLKLSTSSRTVTVTDNLGNTYASEVDTGNCTTARCVEHFVDYSVAGGSGDITVTQSSTLVSYVVFVYQLSCTTCAQDTDSFIVNASGTSHPTSASATVIDTAADATLIASCAAGGATGTETQPTGWEIVAEASSSAYSAYEDDVSTAFTDERGTLTTTNAVTSACAIVSTKETGGGGGGGPPIGSTLLLGVGR